MHKKTVDVHLVYVHPVMCAHLIYIQPDYAYRDMGGWEEVFMTQGLFRPHRVTGSRGMCLGG